MLTKFTEQIDDDSSVTLKSSIRLAQQESTESYAKVKMPKTTEENQKEEELITTQEMSRILDMPFTNSTVVNF